ncbi:MAG: carbon-nitrogen hydrolase [Actinomycetota bacterium]
MKVTVAAIQMAAATDRDANLDQASTLIRNAAAAGANIVLPSELFSLPMFMFGDWKAEHFESAESLDGPTVTTMRALAAELGIVIPTNIFERSNNAHFDTNVIIDADGSIVGTYRKSHIPGGPPNCYEKMYSNPGDTGFTVHDTVFGRIGAAICWDQWFPESARIMALRGAELLFYPSAIGSDCRLHWQRVMQGHAGANLMPLVCANRVGTEKGDLGETTFWGHSFIADQTGEILAQAGDTAGFVTAEFDLDAIRHQRHEWAVFRDRRPDLYGPLLTLDGST